MAEADSPYLLDSKIYVSSSIINNDEFDFCEIIKKSIESDLPLYIEYGLKFTLNQIIHIRPHQKLIIIGYPTDNNNNNNNNNDNNNNNELPVIQSNSHSIFQISGKKSSLSVKNVILHHNCIRESSKEIGGVVFAMNLSSTTMDNCKLISENGFAIWGVQKSVIVVVNSIITSRKRSGVVMFGKSKMNALNSIFIDCKVHGICLRGSCQLSLNNCIFDRCEKRGVYCYNNISLSVVDSEFKNINCISNGAIELVSDDFIISTSDDDYNNNIKLKSNNSKLKNCLSSNILLRLNNCNIHDNGGYGIKIIKSIRDSCNNNNNDYAININDHIIETCIFSNNKNGNYIYCNSSNDVFKNDDDDNNDNDSNNNDKLDFTDQPAKTRWEYECDDSSNNNNNNNDNNNFSKDIPIWLSYDNNNNDEIEKLYFSYKNNEMNKIIELLYPLNNYIINFETYEQTNIITFYSRRIRRVEI